MVGKSHAGQRNRRHAIPQTERVENDAVQTGAHAVQCTTDRFG